MILGIIGTKEYRKPEWVTHMEELQAALKGNESNSLHCLSHGSSFDMSIDSLEVPNLCNYSQRSGRHLASKSCDTLSLKSDSLSEELITPFYMRDVPDTADFTSERSSKCSVQSDPTPKSKNKANFIQSAMTDYLNSHRHSLCSLLELMNSTERRHFENRNKQENSESNLEPTKENVCYQIENPYKDENNQYEEDESKTMFYALSPIEENSEPSTRSSSCRNSSGSDKRKINAEYPNQLSSSCDPIPSEPMHSLPMNPKYQTFPRSKFTIQSNSDDGLHNSVKFHPNDSATYPLEPREIDPFAYHQLHTADSQEELQEFLLLESECMNDNKGRGLASAFDEIADDYNT